MAPHSAERAGGAHAESRSSRLPQITPPLPRAAALVTDVAVPAVAAALVTTWSPCASVCPGFTLITAASVLTPAVAALFAAPVEMPDAAAGGPWLNSAPPPGGVTGPVVPLGVPPPPAEPSPAVQGVCADSVCGVGPCVGVGVALGVLLGVLVVLGPGLGVLVTVVVDPFAPTWPRVPGAVRCGGQCSNRQKKHTALLIEDHGLLPPRHDLAIAFAKAPSPPCQALPGQYYAATCHRLPAEGGFE